MTLLAQKLNQLGLSQQDIAKKVNVSQPYVSAVLKGKVLKYNATKKFADAFGFDLIELVADFEHLENSGSTTSQKLTIFEESEFTEPDKKSDAMRQLSAVRKKNGKTENIKEQIFHTVEAYVLPVKGRLGLGSSYYADSFFESELSKTTVSVMEKPLNANRFILAEFEGESMTNGEPDQIPNGSWLILAERKRGDDWQSNMEGKIMGFFDRDDNFTVKRVKQHNATLGYVILEALNPDKTQPENQDRELEIKNCWAIYDYISKLS